MLTILLLIIPYSPVIENQVAVYELNHFYGEDGKHVFSQHIFWDHDGGVIGWRISKRDAPVSCRQSLVFHDGVDEDSGMMRRIRFDSYIQSWTQFDREMINREVVPRASRKELSNRP